MEIVNKELTQELRDAEEQAKIAEALLSYIANVKEHYMTNSKEQNNTTI